MFGPPDPATRQPDLTTTVGPWRFYSDGTVTHGPSSRTRVIDILITTLPETHRKKSRVGRVMGAGMTGGLNLLSSPHRYGGGTTRITVVTEAWAMSQAYNAALHSAALVAKAKGEQR